MKSKITLTIDSDVYLVLKSKELNVSSMVNEFLRSYLIIEESDVDEQQMQDDILEKQKMIQKLQNEVAEKSTSLATYRQRKRKEQDEFLKQSIQINDVMRANNPFRRAQ